MNKEVEYLKEHLYEIYKCKKSMKDLTYDMDIEHLLRTCKALDYLQHQLEQKEKVIKEAREYIENDVEVYYVLDTRLNKSFDKTKKVKKDLLEILEKVEENK